MKYRFRRRLVDLAQAQVARGGQSGLAEYVRKVKRMLPGDLPWVRRIRSSLLALPGRQESVLPIRTGDLTFLYASSPADNLFEACRDDFRAWEPISRRFFSLMAREAMLIVDIGAYSGVYSLTAALSNPHSRVWAFEPNPVMHDCLETNVRLNDAAEQVQLFAVALAGADRRDRLYLHANGDSILSSLVPSAGSTAIEVDARTLDSLIADHRVDLMKIDVEGGEPGVLEGSLRTLMRHHPVILMEALTPDDLDAQQGILRPMGYLEPIPVNADAHDRYADHRNYVWTTAVDEQLVARTLVRAQASRQ